MLLPCEIQEAQRDYAILFRKHPETGHFFPSVLLGFEQKENLFLTKDGAWAANYVPFSIAKGPFFIGFSKNEELESQQPLVYVDLDDSRVGFDNGGERVFSDSGELSPYMLSVSQTLRLMHENMQDIQYMVEAFASHDLIEPLALKITFKNGEEMNFGGAYTIDAEKLASLTAQQLFELNKSGYLSAAYFIAGSVQNIKRLIDIKNAKQ